jgi:hypothetical protein
LNLAVVLTLAVLKLVSKQIPFSLLSNWTLTGSASAIVLIGSGRPTPRPFTNAFALGFVLPFNLILKAPSLVADRSKYL